MKRAFIVTLAATLCAAPLALGTPAPAATPAKAQTKAPASAAPKAAASSAKPASTTTGAYHAPRTSFGQPDLQGFWSNATITTESRPAGLGNRLTYTPDEVRKLENDVQVEVAAGNRPTDPNAPTFAKGGQAIDPGIRQQFAGPGGGTGGYNRGWIDPGSAVMRVHGEPRTSILTTPDGRPPARKAGAVVATAARGLVTGGGEGDDAGPPAPGAGRGGGGRGGAGAGRGGAAGRGGGGGGGAMDNPESRPLAERCIISFGRNAGPPMLPNGFYNNNYQFVQGKDSIAIWVELVHDVRVIRLNSKHRTDGVRPWYGDSIGHFEGDTLVVETTNIPQSLAYNGSWQNLTVTERFTRASRTRMLYQYTIHDPTMWDADWGGEYEFDALPRGEAVYEYACHEGNYALGDVLAGARAEDAAAKTSAAR